jgi:hypothetical protein
MSRQMMRVISSPSISTIGFLTLIFAILWSHLLRVGIGPPPRSRGGLYSIDLHAVKAARNADTSLGLSLGSGYRLASVTLKPTPLMPAKAGIPFFEGRSPRFRGDERAVS